MPVTWPRRGRPANVAKAVRTGATSPAITMPGWAAPSIGLWPAIKPDLITPVSQVNYFIAADY